VWYGKHCPAQIRNRGMWGTVVQMTREAFNRAVAASKGQSVPSNDYKYGEPITVNGKKWDGTTDVKANGRTYYGDVKTVHVAVDSLNRRIGPFTNMTLSGPPLPKDEPFSVLGWCVGEEVDGENRWWVTPWGSHFWVGGTVEKPTVR